jgi:hypothetical protein
VRRAEFLSSQIRRFGKVAVGRLPRCSRKHRNWIRQAGKRETMSTDLTVVFERKSKAKRDSKADLAIASVWLALYLLMLVGVLTTPFLARAVEFAGLY